jgi:hypothetical protein
MSGKTFSINNSVPSKVLFLILAFGPISQKTIQSILHPNKKSGQIPKVLNQLEDNAYIERRMVKAKPVIKVIKSKDQKTNIEFYIAQKELKETRILGCIPTFKNYSELLKRDLNEKEKKFISIKLAQTFSTPFTENHLINSKAINLDSILNSILLEELTKRAVLELTFKDKFELIQKTIQSKLKNKIKPLNLLKEIKEEFSIENTQTNRFLLLRMLTDNTTLTRKELLKLIQPFVLNKNNISSPDRTAINDLYLILSANEKEMII